MQTDRLPDKPFGRVYDPKPNTPARYVRDYSPEEQTKLREDFRRSAGRYRRDWRVAYMALGIGLGGGLLTRLVISATMEEWLFGVFYAGLVILACVASLASGLNSTTHHLWYLLFALGLFYIPPIVSAFRHWVAFK